VAPNLRTEKRGEGDASTLRAFHAPRADRQVARGVRGVAGHVPSQAHGPEARVHRVDTEQTRRSRAAVQALGRARQKQKRAQPLRRIPRRHHATNARDEGPVLRGVDARGGRARGPRRQVRGHARASRDPPRDGPLAIRDGYE